MAFPKGNKLGGRHKGSLNKSTLLKEERRAIFDAEISGVFKEKIHEARAEYVLDQFLGKTPEKIEMVVETKPNKDMIELAKRLDDIQYTGKGARSGGVNTGSVGGETPTQE